MGLHLKGTKCLLAELVKKFLLFSVVSGMLLTNTELNSEFVGGTNALYREGNGRQAGEIL